MTRLILSVSRFFWPLSVLVALLAVFPFVPGLHGGFLLDDDPNIVRNGLLHLHNPSFEDFLYAAYSFQPGGSTRPLSMLSFALDYMRAGLDPGAFKLTNLIIHGVTTLVLGVFFRRLFESNGRSPREALAAALFLALLWAVHPLQVSAVLYVVQRMQTLCTLFLLLALLAYLKMRSSQIAGETSRHWGLLTLFFWALAFASKEDGALLPAYTLALELTVLRFRASQQLTARAIFWAYGIGVVLGALAYFFVVIPHYWTWENYTGRLFSTPERLLTQGRVLVMHLWQMLLPYPDNMRFFYDDMPISRSIWQPYTTLPAWGGLLALLVWAWCWRHKRPLFSLGILIFFLGHFITSNVIPLEMVFEHRNHFPLVGIVLAVGDLVGAFVKHSRLRPVITRSLALCVLILLAVATWSRSYIWGDNLRLALYTHELAPDSERAWILVCNTYYERSRRNNSAEDLDRAIDVCQKGAERIPSSVSLANNILIYKTVKGTATQADWDFYLDRLRRAPITSQVIGVLWVTLNNAELGKYDNEEGVLETIEIIAGQLDLSSSEYLRIGAYIFNETNEPFKALGYLKKAVEHAREDDPAIAKMLHELGEAGRKDWVEILEQVRRQKK